MLMPPADKGRRLGDAYGQTALADGLVGTFQAAERLSPGGQCFSLRPRVVCGPAEIDGFLVQGGSVRGSVDPVKRSQDLPS